jgi:hypothetical protein
MSGLAVFGMKYPSLLRFNNDSSDPVVRENLRNLYRVEKAPSDPRMREILGLLDPNAIRPAFKAVFSQLQNGKELQPFRFIHDAYFVSIDGTSFFSSHEVHCENCCIKQSRDGTITYYHQMLGTVVVHPEQKQLITLVPEPIIKQAYPLWATRRAKRCREPLQCREWSAFLLQPSPRRAAWLIGYYSGEPRCLISQIFLANLE